MQIRAYQSNFFVYLCFHNGKDSFQLLFQTLLEHFALLLCLCFPSDGVGHPEYLFDVFVHDIYIQNQRRIQMIRFILLQNRRGRTRLSKWFINYDENEKNRLQSQIHRMIVGRDSKQTDFIQFHNFKIVYKRYQGLYFAICIDINDNELLYLELIHMFVENLDNYFGNVCELDIVFNFHKVYGILDEIVVGGEVLETAKDIIVASLKNLEIED